MSTFALQISAWVEKTKGDLDQVTRYALTAIDKRIMFRSPVGAACATEGGCRRALSWQLADGNLEKPLRLWHDVGDMILT